MTDPGKVPRGVTVSTAVALVLVLIYVCGLAALYGRTNGWLIDATGLPRSNEYMGLRAAGDLALQGRAQDAYDWLRHDAAMAKLAGREGMAYFPFPYPPTFLLLMAALATLPYLLSVAVWLGGTGALYVWMVGSTLRPAVQLRVAAIWALATPAAAINTFVAHTGFATAGVMGLALQAIPKRPVVAGVLMALLAVKPQVAVLVPVALIAGGHWRVIWVAACTVLGLGLGSVLCFGVEPWSAWLGQVMMIQDAARFGHPRIGETNFTVLVSVYGALRSISASDRLAMALQAVAALAMAGAVFALWRSHAPYALKAAGVASASLLATPYVFIYDLLHVSIAIAFLVRHTGVEGIQRQEISVICGAGVMMIAPLFLPLPLGFAANAFIAAIVFARAWPHIRTWAQPAAP